jgi:serpin B
VEEQTKNTIKDLLAPGTINEAKRLVLTHAIYFKGMWESKFEQKWTREAPFTLVDGTEVMVPMMHQTGSFGYSGDAGLQVLEMPYKSGQLSMVVMLPSKKERLESFEKSEKFESLGQVVGSLGTRRVEVYLPKFKITSTYQLGTALAKLGMTDAFSWPGADFSGMTGKKDLFIGDVAHKAFVEVNEEGTEAAAATGTLFKAGGGSDKIPVFKADHPFVFLIRHKPSGTILFLGRVTNP